ncbi:MAG: hypothetical protein HGA41_03990 [Syntrophaceae bacterium]|jgi:hypothetical protein|nr:hypothetical protein [Syntrophaceae bacterium]
MMKNIIIIVAALIAFSIIWFYFQEDEKKIGIYTVYYYSSRCNPNELPSSLPLLMQTQCVKKITWMEQTGPKLYKRMSWTPETGAKESGMVRK